MGLMDLFAEYLDTIDIYSLSTETSDWSTTESEYPTTVTKRIDGYIQPLSGGDAFQNQKLGEESTHRLYTRNDVSLNDTDKLVYNGVTYKVTYNQTKGISGINDHFEIGLRVV